VPYNIQDLIKETIPSRFRPSFEYYPVIENRISDMVLKKIKGICGARDCGFNRSFAGRG